MRALLAALIMLFAAPAFAGTESVYAVDYHVDKHVNELMESTMRMLKEYNIECVIHMTVIPHDKYYKTEVTSLRGTSQLNKLFIRMELWVQEDRTIVRSYANIDLKAPRYPLLELIPGVKMKKREILASVKSMVERQIIQGARDEIESIGRKYKR